MNIEVIDLEKAGKNYRKILILFFVFSIGMGGLIVGAFFLPMHENYTTMIAIVLLLILLAGMGAFRPRLMYYKEDLMFERLKGKQSPKISTSISPLSESFFVSLVNQEFKVNHKDERFTILTKYIKDKKQYHTKRPMLMVYVAIHDPKLDYQNSLIIQYINAIEDQLYKNKQRIMNYTVFVSKEGSQMTGEDKEDCNNVSFSRIGKRSIVTINLFYETKNQSCYFLYSNDYWPTSYYKFAVEFIKDLL